MDWMEEEGPEAGPVVEAEIMDAPSGVSGAVAIRRGEIMAQVEIANAAPRSVARFEADARELACMNRSMAAACGYTLKRGGKPITGPSIRLAEIVAYAWMHIVCGSRVVAEEAGFIVAEGYCLDVQRNRSETVQVRRRITSKNGQRYSEDMVAVTANAACSIAKRNAIFAVVPRVFVDRIYEAAMATAMGKEKPLEERRREVVDRLLKLCESKGLKVGEADILAAVDRTSIEDVVWADVKLLIGYGTSIADGEQSASEIFGEKAAKQSAPEPPPSPDVEARREKIGKKPAPKDSPQMVERIEAICADPNLRGRRPDVEAIVRANAPGGMPDVDAIDDAVEALLAKIEEV